MSGVKVEFTAEKLKEFKRLYTINAFKESFEFEGNTYVKAYAKYLIGYLEMHFEPRGKLKPISDRHTITKTG